MNEEYLKNIKPRKYQQEIFNTCKDNNCLVVLPTGIGKTLIALMLAIERQKKYPSEKILFLAPTRPLAEQHLNYFKKHLPELFGEMNLFTGKVTAENRRKMWEKTDIVFSTPQCISNDIKKNLYTLENISLLIEDECHRCLKNYSYVYVVERYKAQAKNQRILGLTASPGTEVKTIKQIAANLGINAIELRTRESEDVKEYLQELNFEKISVDFPEEFNIIRNLIKAVYDRKTDELKKRRLLFGPPTKKSLLECQSMIMRAISSGNKNFNLFSGASACAQAVKLHHAMELLETQTLSSFYDYLLDLFEQARLKKSKAVQQLIKQTEFNAAYHKLIELIARKQEHPKLAKLKDIIEQQIQKNPLQKTIVFSQYRSTVSKISKELNFIKNINSRVFIGQAKKIDKNGQEAGMTQKEQQRILEQFKSGEINILCSTSIGEEGLDIPEVNSVIFYEPVPSAIRSIQRRGRTARLQEGSLIILITKNTRDESYYWSAFHKEKKMYKAIETLKNQIDAENKSVKEKQGRLFD